MKRLILSSIAFGMLVSFSGCAVKSGNVKLENLKREDVSKVIVKGSTTENGVRELFGEPQSTDFMADGRKKWKYSFMKKSEKGVNYVPVVNWFTRGTNDEIKSLVVIFKNDVVDDYMFSSSKGETNSGAFN
jgi:hypothetical protein